MNMHSFSNIKRLLVLPVGGGNDGISSLWLLRQLASMGLNPDIIDMVCMLPDGIQYHQVIETHCPGLFEIQASVYRTINHKKIKDFPEPTLAGSKDRFGIRKIYGAQLTAGSSGFSQTLQRLVKAGKYELLLAVDVGGDFIALPENIKVLSPFMDAYGAFALQELQDAKLVDMIGAVMGLGTDGETEPSLLPKTLSAISPFLDGVLDAKMLEPVTEFYINQVKALRRSQTGDLMVDALRGNLKSSYTVSRYFHVLTEAGSQKYTAQQTFQLDGQYTKKFYLFDNFKLITNRFVCPCSSSLEWLSKTQDSRFRFQHELVNQVIEDTLVATPSWVFPEETKHKILNAIGDGLRTGLYQKAVVYKQDLESLGHAPNITIIGNASE